MMRNLYGQRVTGYIGQAKGLMMNRIEISGKEFVNYTAAP